MSPFEQPNRIDPIEPISRLSSRRAGNNQAILKGSNEVYLRSQWVFMPRRVEVVLSSRKECVSNVHKHKLPSTS
jgi:hypothetical protein